MFLKTNFTAAVGHMFIKLRELSAIAVWIKPEIVAWNLREPISFELRLDRLVYCFSSSTSGTSVFPAILCPTSRSRRLFGCEMTSDSGDDSRFTLGLGQMTVFLASWGREKGQPSMIGKIDDVGRTPMDPVGGII